MKINFFVIFLLASNSFFSQKVDSILMGKFINSIEIDNNQILNIKYQNNDSIHFFFSKDSSFVIITQGDCKSLDIRNLKKPCNRISIFSSDGNKFFNVFGFQKTDMKNLLDHINSTNQKVIFKATVSKVFNIEFFEMEEIFETWEKFSLKMTKYERKIDKHFKIIDPNPYAGDKIW
jgi:hypothetical protein